MAVALDWVRRNGGRVELSLGAGQPPATLAA
jgi:hypothetical protein